MSEFSRNPEVSKELIEDIFTQCRIYEQAYNNNNFMQSVDVNGKWWTVEYNPGDDLAPELLNIYRELENHPKCVVYSLDVTSKEVLKQDKTNYQPKGRPFKHPQPVTDASEIGLLHAIVTRVHEVNIKAE